MKKYENMMSTGVIYDWRNEEELIRNLAECVRREIKPRPVDERQPGDEKKLTKRKIAAETGLNRSAILTIEQGDLKRLPTLDTLLKLCNVFGCELEYLLGFQEQKIKSIGTVSDITGLDAETVSVLASKMDFKRSNREAPTDNTETIRADDFLQYLITHEHKAELFDRVSEERDYCFLEKALPILYEEEYRIAQEVLDDVIKELGFDRRKSDLYLGVWSVNKTLWDHFFSKLAERLGIDEEMLDDWLKNKMHLTRLELFGTLQQIRTKQTRIRIIDDCFMGILQDYLKEVNDAEK